MSETKHLRGRRPCLYRPSRRWMLPIILPRWDKHLTPRSNRQESHNLLLESHSNLALQFPTHLQHRLGSPKHLPHRLASPKHLQHHHPNLKLYHQQGLNRLQPPQQNLSHHQDHLESKAQPSHPQGPNHPQSHPPNHRHPLESHKRQLYPQQGPTLQQENHKHLWFHLPNLRHQLLLHQNLKPQLHSRIDPNRRRQSPDRWPQSHSHPRPKHLKQLNPNLLLLPPSAQPPRRLQTTRLERKPTFQRQKDKQVAVGAERGLVGDESLYVVEWLWMVLVHLGLQRYFFKGYGACFHGIRLPFSRLFGSFLGFYWEQLQANWSTFPCQFNFMSKVLEHVYCTVFLRRCHLKTPWFATPLLWIRWFLVQKS